MEQQENTTSSHKQSIIPNGWIGGFSETPPYDHQPYPNEALLSHLELQDNMKNIKKITRMLRAKWPEFSWEVKKGHPSTRKYQMFAPDISRLGYDDKGQVWSIICPQQGLYLPSVGLTMNIEVTVTGNRGWIDELAIKKDEIFAADVGIKPTIWFSPDTENSFLWRQLMNLDNLWDGQLPLSKAKGIRINTTDADGTDNFVKVRMGTYPDWLFPTRADHWDDYAWVVAHLGVMIGAIENVSNTHVQKFNTKVMELFNIASGNLLQNGNTLVWNLWAGSPELVDQEEWGNHANYWRHSIDVNHQPAEGEGTAITDINGDVFVPDHFKLDLKLAEFAAWVAYHLV